MAEDAAIEAMVEADLKGVSKPFKETLTFARIKECLIEQGAPDEASKYSVALNCVHDTLSQSFGCDYNVDEILRSCRPKRHLSDCAMAALPAYVMCGVLALILIIVGALYYRQRRR